MGAFPATRFLHLDDKDSRPSPGPGNDLLRPSRVRPVFFAKMLQEQTLLHPHPVSQPRQEQERDAGQPNQAGITDANPQCHQNKTSIARMPDEAIGSIRDEHVPDLYTQVTGIHPPDGQARPEADDQAKQDDDQPGQFQG
jgi:hypothetical protein